ncbi:MAG: hypothetical protein OER96_07620 [Gammaproteobacteria bacterium]|nr:hypothetical protein [Gammaproteobacteria bacterium]
MADFNQAYKATLGHEGGYANDPNESGGETYKGISRVHHPNWSGWKRVDAAKEKAGFPRSLETDTALQTQVRTFYKRYYWDRIQGDHVPDQQIAEEIFDTGINIGLRRAVRFLQEAINLLDRKPPKDGIAIDGWLGDKTLKALRRNLKHEESNIFVMRLLNILQGNRYVEIMRQKPVQERFARGWLRRVQL